MDVAEFAHWWFDEVRSGDMRSAWPKMSDNYRTCIAQASMMTMHDRGDPVDELLRRFAAADIEGTQMADDFLTNARGSLLQVIPSDILRADVAAASRPRPLSAGLELVPLVVLADAVDDGFGPSIPDGGQARAARVLVEDGRLVAGLDHLLSPGWPPTILYMPSADE